jgi:hypothetical protein
MHPEKVWIVIVLLVVILVFSNLAMFALVRGWMPRKGKKNFLQGFTQPWKTQDDKLKELSERVKELNPDDETEQT